MRMNTYVRGYGPPSQKWARMADIYHLCREAEVTLPEEVECYFEDGAPDSLGQEIEIPHRDWTPEDKGWLAHGIEVVVAEIPENVKVIRFINSY